ncbi:MAG TPA: hypothetical protein VM737_05910 [Gemmatimonadota bacterium]|nr:hypothetical protein [Gemmatimonadota bacterium]
MAEVGKARTHPSVRSILRRYDRIALRTEPLDRLVDFLTGTPDPLEWGDRDLVIGRQEWESWDTRRRHRAVGFLRRRFLVARHALRPPIYYSRTARNDLFDRAHSQAIGELKVVFRHKDVPMAALAPKYLLPVAPLLGLSPRLKFTPIEDLAVILNSRLFHFFWQHCFSRRPGHTPPSPLERLARFKVPMLTKRIGGPFRATRDSILKLAAENSDRLSAMDQVEEIAEAGGVPLMPLGQTEGIIREINVPKPLGELTDVKRRGPVVIFRRGSTIVTTTEEAATYLELWLQERFDWLRGLDREDLEEHIRMPLSTAHVVVVLQRRARIQAEIDRVQSRIDELQLQAEDQLYDLYGLNDAERGYLRSSIA